jgi:hypothetical protein
MTEQQRFEHFVQELTTISRKHGVGVMSIGGVFLLNEDEAAQHIAYSCDAERGNLEFNLNGGEPCQTPF